MNRKEEITNKLLELIEHVKDAPKNEALLAVGLDIAEWADEHPREENIAAYLGKKGWPLSTYGIPTFEEASKTLKVDNANKVVVEPKFKVGDWVVDNCGYAWRIEGIINQFYILEGIDGGESRPTIELANKTFHLWTIEDAKDGDVLFEDKISSLPSPFIVIFKTKDSVNTFSSHCFIGFDGNFYEGEGEHYSENLHPATKEQRDTLEKAMADAGYTFDFEKKELKKIHLIDEGKAEMDYCFTKMMNGEKVKPQSSTPMSYGKELEERMYEACNRFFAPNTDPNRYSAAKLFYAGVQAERDLNTLALSEEETIKADKIEPKFHEGDFIVNDYCMGKVIALTDDAYLLDTEQGIPFSCEHNAHLWTIEDAKPGDVLSNGKMIVIFKDFAEPSYKQHIVAYIGLDRGGKIQITDDTWRLGIDKAKPATKEQCELLFQKMKEAGYEWDAEKLELIKVPKTKEPEGTLKQLLDEQKKFYEETKIVLEDKDTALAFLRRMGIIDEYGELSEKYRSEQTLVPTVFPIEWKQENVDELSKFEMAMMHIGGSFFGEKAGLDPNDTATIKEQAKLLLELVTKQEWSEEDESMLHIKEK